MVLEQFIIDADIIWDQVGKTFFENPEAKPGRIMRVQVVNAGIIEDLTGYTLNLGWTSVRDPSKFGLDAFDDVDIIKGIFEIEYTSGMLTNVGPLNASLQLVPPREGRPIESNNFKLTVKNSAINPEAIQGETSFKALENALVEVNGWNTRIDVVEQEFKDRADALDGAYPVRLTAAEQSVAAVEAQVDLLNRGLGETMPTMAALLSTYPTGDTRDHIVAGNIAEVDTLTVTAIPTAAGNITITLNGVAKTVAVDPAVQSTTALVATAIRAAVYTGWTTGGNGSIVTFTATTVGTRTAPAFSGDTTGTTGTFVRTAIGEAANFHRYFWNGTAWTDGGIYQAVELIDNSVTQSKIKYNGVLRNRGIAYPFKNVDRLGTVYPIQQTFQDIILDCTIYGGDPTKLYRIEFLGNGGSVGGAVRYTPNVFRYNSDWTGKTSVIAYDDSRQNNNPPTAEIETRTYRSYSELGMTMVLTIDWSGFAGTNQINIEGTTGTIAGSSYVLDSSKILPKMQYDQTISGAVITDNTLSGAALKTATLNGGTLIDSTVNGIKISNGTVTGGVSGKIATETITSDNLAQSYSFRTKRFTPATANPTITTKISTGTYFVDAGTTGMPSEIAGVTCTLEVLLCQDRFQYEKIYSFSNPKVYFIRYFDANSISGEPAWSKFDVTGLNTTVTNLGTQVTDATKNIGDKLSENYVKHIVHSLSIQDGYNGLGERQRAYAALLDTPITTEMIGQTLQFHLEFSLDNETYYNYALSGFKIGLSDNGTSSSVGGVFTLPQPGTAKTALIQLGKMVTITQDYSLTIASNHVGATHLFVYQIVYLSGDITLEREIAFYNERCDNRVITVRQHN